MEKGTFILLLFSGVFQCLLQGKGVSCSCGDVDEIEFAVISYHPAGLAPHPEGSNATVACSIHYQVAPVAFQQLLTCINGSWLTEARAWPKCRHVPRLCQRNEVSVQLYGRQCQTPCRNRNPVCPGIDDRCYCDGSCGWSCISNEDNFCPEVSERAGILVSYEPPQRRFHGYASFSCTDGYIHLSGSSRLRCMSNRQWGQGTQFLCRPDGTRCPEIVSLAHGRVNSRGNEFESVVTFECNDGYRLDGNARRVCQGDKTWSGQETVCTEIICPDPGVPTNGYMTNEKPVYHHNDAVYYGCNDGFTMDGSVLNYCRESGEWAHPVPVCGGPCIIPSHPRDGGWTYGNRPGTSVNHKTRLGVRCNDRRFTVRLSSLECNNGEWSDSDDVQRLCEGRPCRVRSSDGLTVAYDPPLREEDLQRNQVPHNTRVQYTCVRGYRLNVGEETRCNHGQYHRSPHTPRCELEIICPDPGVPTNGYMTNEKLVYRHNDAVYYGCNDGFTMDGSVLNYCRESGEWAHPVPVCGEPCIIPHYPRDGGWTYGNRPRTSVNHKTRIGVRCNWRFTVRLSSLECNNGEWSDSDGVQRLCEGTPCNVRSSDGLTVTYDPPLREEDLQRNQVPHDTRVRYTCGRGYSLNGREETRCNHGLYDRSLTTPTCEPGATCPELQPPSNGTKVGGNRVGESVLIGCNQGYQLQGEGFLHCLPTRNWSHPLPTCVKYKPCGEAGNVLADDDHLAKEKAWPWLSVIHRNSSTGPIRLCSGTLLCQQWVLTTSSCFINQDDGEVLGEVLWSFDEDKEIKVTVTLGEHNVSVGEGCEQTISVNRIILHEQYDYDHPHDYDVALLHLSEPVELNSCARTICLPSETDTLHDPTVVGWGNAKGLPQYTRDVPIQFPLPLADQTHCRTSHLIRRFDSPRFNVTDRMLCAGERYGVDPLCQGDHGSPLMYRRSGDDKWAMIGINTMGETCFLFNRYGIYTRIDDDLTQWINDMTSNCANDPI